MHIEDAIQIISNNSQFHCAAVLVTGVLVYPLVWTGSVHLKENGSQPGEAP